MNPNIETTHAVEIGTDLTDAPIEGIDPPPQAAAMNGSIPIGIPPPPPDVVPTPAPPRPVPEPNPVPPEFEPPVIVDPPPPGGSVPVRDPQPSAV